MPILTFIIIGITVYTTHMGLTVRGFSDRLMFIPSCILGQKQHYRLLSSALIHADWRHCCFNLLSFYFFASGMEATPTIGRSGILVIYVGSILGGSAVSLYLHRHHEYRALGASGGVSGILFASIFLIPGGSIILFPVPLPLPTWIYAVGYLLGSCYGMLKQGDGIGHDAHLGGALSGVLIATLIDPHTVVVRQPVLYGIVLMIFVAIIVYVYKNPAYLPGSNPFSREARQDRERSRGLKKKMKTQDDSRDEEYMLNQLLEKISSGGIESLTRAERAKLESLSRGR